MKFTLLDGSISSYFGGIVHSIFPWTRGEGRTRQWLSMNGQVPKWISTENLWKVYTDIPHLQNVINTRADLLSQGKIKLIRIKDKVEIEQHEVLTLLSKPNPLQTQAEFLTMYLTFKDIWANVLILKNKGLPSMKIPNQLWNLPPALMRIDTTGKIFRQTTINEIIKGYILTINGVEVTYLPDEVIFKNDNLGSEYIMSESKLVGLVKPLSNIHAALRTANVLIGDHGAYGIISSNNKDISGGIPLGKDEKKRIEQDVSNDYGNKPGQKQMIVTDANLTYTPIGSSINEMNLQPEIEQAFGIILDAYKVDRDIFASTKGATFENKKNGLKATIQNTIQQEGDDLMQTFNIEFGLIEQGLKLTMCYDHLPVMQEDEQKRADTIAKKVDSISKMIFAGVLSPAQGQDLLKKITTMQIDDSLGKPDDKWYQYYEPKDNAVQQTQTNGGGN